MENEISDKKLIIAFVLTFFFGTLGFHRAYAGKIGTAIVMFLLSMTLIGCIVTVPWVIIDAFTILSGSFTDKDGKLIKQ